jgi:2-(1,2-epoxy-1,2-dihydrophenyl)acetyl-CoA isomerase
VAYETVTYEVQDGIGTITLNRPKRLNAIDQTLSRELREALAEAAADRLVRCVVLTGAGRGFCAGLDLSQVPPDVRTFTPGDALRASFHPLIHGIVGMEKPVIAAVNGTAAGAGASLALACDFRLAATEASFLQAFVRIGLVPDSGATYFLPRLIGYARALELAMLGEIVDAERALEIGLVNRVVPADDLAKETEALARRLADGPTYALALTRKAMIFGANADLEHALDYEADLQTLAASTADAFEGIAAFLEKRPARFTGY